MECVSCKKQASNMIKLPCPKCKKEILRCSKCRSLSIEYKCPSCGFVGP